MLYSFFSKVLSYRGLFDFARQFLHAYTMDFITSTMTVNIFNNVSWYISPLVEVVCLALKGALLFKLYEVTTKAKRNRHFYYFVTILATGLITHLSLLFLHLGNDPSSFISPRFFNSLLRIELGTLTVQFFVFLTFFKEFSSQQIRSKLFSLFYMVAAALSGLYVAYYIGWGCYTYATGIIETSDLGRTLALFHQGFFLLEGVVALLVMQYNYRKESVALLRHHMRTLGLYFMAPYVLGKITETDFFAPTMSLGSGTMTLNLISTVFTSLWLTAMLFYISKKLVGMRFLNIRPHVASNTSGKFDFFEVFKTALGKLGAITHQEEVLPVTKEFFEGVFKIPQDRISLHFRTSPEHMHDEALESQHQRHYVEEILSADTAAHKAVVDYTHRLKVLIRDEIEFTHFSSPAGPEKEKLSGVIEFLRTLGADIFLPIYSDAKLVAYLIVERGARVDRLFTDVERDEMLIYCNYLGSLIYLLGTMNLETLQARERALRLEAFKKGRLLALLKQSVYPFVGVGKTRKVGVLTYKK